MWPSTGPPGEKAMEEPDPALLDIGDCGRTSLAWEGLGSSVWARSTMLSGPAKNRSVPGSLSRVPVVDGNATARVRELEGSTVIGKGEIHLWFAPLDLPPGALAAMAETMDPGELARGAIYRFELHRRRYVTAHAALRRILSTYTGLAPRRIRYASEAFGRPQLAPDINPGRLDFSLSHSGGLAAVAIARGHRVGIDVEQLKGLSPEDELVERTLSTEEWSAWRRRPPEARTGAFLWWWTRKEACLKADGHGLRGDPRHVPVGTDSDGGPHWSLVTPYGHARPRWAVCSLDVIPGFVASVAVVV